MALTCHSVTSVLSPWGVDGRGEQLYRAVLRHPGRHVDDLATMLGWSPRVVNDALRALVRTRLVRDAGESGLFGASPGTAIEGLLAREEHRISQLRRQLSEARASISEFTHEHRAGSQDRSTPVPIDVVAGEEVGAAVEDLTRSTEGDLVLLQPEVTSPQIGDRPGLRDLTVQQLADGRPMRTVYPASVVDDEAAMESLRFWSDAGEVTRIKGHLPARVFVFGGEAALIPSEWGSSAGSALVVRTPALVAGLREYVECVWSQSVPLPRSRSSQADEERRRLLQLLSMGVKDEALARHLGLSLRTVRRRVADLILELGVTTRFQAGMEAARRGWI